MRLGTRVSEPGESGRYAASVLPAVSLRLTEERAGGKNGGRKYERVEGRIKWWEG
jgi:hypothetical protein